MCGFAFPLSIPLSLSLSLSSSTLPPLSIRADPHNCHLHPCRRLHHAAARYEDRAAYFRDSRESKLLKDVSGAVENEDPDLFTEIIREYDAVSKLDSWMTQILLKIKKQASSDDLL